MTSNKKQNNIDGSSELFSVRNNLYFGNYSTCISIGSELEFKSTDLKLERDILLYRANIGLGQYELVLNEIQDSKETPYGLRVKKFKKN
jgi:coatomer subunit epsilon